MTDELNPRWLFVPENNPLGLVEGMYPVIDLIKMALTDEQASFVADLMED